MLKITPTDSSLEKNGTKTNYRGVTLIIARSNNVKFRSVFNQLSKPYRKEIQDNSINEKDSRDIMIQAFARAILVGWEDFQIDGREVPYTLKNAIDLLTNDPDCYDFVSDFSGNLSNYLVEEEDELVKK